MTESDTAAGWASEVLAFWFGELTPEDWFEVKPETDEAIRRRFLELHETMRGATPDNAMKEPPAALAAVIVFDQFPRNMFRKSAGAFSTDNLALTVARNAVENGFDADFSTQQKQFLYMPFMHSEVTADQERCVMLFKELGDENALRYAVEHRDIVARFGRFPHRNAALGRASTADELAFLHDHEGFGQ